MRLQKFIICTLTAAALALCGTITASAEELPLEDYRAVQSEFELLQDTYEICEEYEVDPEIIFAIMWHESRMQPDIADSPTNDRGLMQINKINWGWLAEEGLDVNEPLQNIEAGALIFSKFAKKYNTEYALRCYAAGEKGAASGGGAHAAKEIMDIMAL